MRCSVLRERARVFIDYDPEDSDDEYEPEDPKDPNEDWPLGY